MFGELRKAMTTKLKVDELDADGKTIHKAGEKKQRGAICPKCGQWHALAIRVSACNFCGFKVKANTIPTAWQIRKHEKIQARQKRWADEKKKLEAMA